MVFTLPRAAKALRYVATEPRYATMVVKLYKMYMNTTYSGCKTCCGEHTNTCRENMLSDRVI